MSRCTLKSACWTVATMIVALMWSLAVFQSAQAESSNKHSIAVIVGNKSYGKDIPEVSFAHNDAEAMKKYVIEVLGYREGNIIELQNATGKQLEAVFGNEKNHEGKLFDWVRPGKSNVVVFYSGHGVPGMKDRRAYLLPTDGDANRAEITGYPVDTLYANLTKLPARSIQVFLDACFSGATPKGMLIEATSGISVIPKAPLSTSKLVTLSAARGDQVASWDKQAKHGLFTMHLLTALYGVADGKDYGNGDGKVSLEEVQSYLDDEMTYQARRRYGRRQNASVNGKGETILASIQAGLKFSVLPRSEPKYSTTSKLREDKRPVDSAVPQSSAETSTKQNPIVVSRVDPAGKLEGNWKLEIHTGSSGQFGCFAEEVRTKAVMAGFNLKASHPLLESFTGRLDEINNEKISGRFATNNYIYTYDLKLENGRWSGSWHIPYGGYTDGCQGKLTMYR